MDEKERINLQGEINRLNYIVEDLRKDNYKKFEVINKLNEENEQLKHEYKMLRKDHHILTAFIIESTGYHKYLQWRGRNIKSNKPPYLTWEVGEKRFELEGEHDE